jgi:methyltransferase (TIGR00027 family)
VSTDPIRHISDTALWVAAYRAQESERPGAHFRDPYAGRLAGERGQEMARSVRFSHRHSWSYVARTHLVNELILREIEAGADLVLNLAAGLDARPYWMELPTSLHWVEVDLPELLAYKEDVLRGERPRCALERVACDLGDVPTRRELFRRLGGERKRALIITEGLLIYFTAEEVGSLGRDLAEPASFQRWATDLASPALLKMLQKHLSGPLSRANAPLRFAPREGADFFTAQGWKPLQVTSLLHTAARLKRLPSFMRLFAWFPDPKGKKPDRPWGGVVLLGKQ